MILENKRAKWLILLFCSLVVPHLRAAEEGSIDGISSNRVTLDGETFLLKGYPKRDRFLPGDTTEVSPSQLHEVIGPRVDAGFEYTNTKLKSDGDGAHVISPAGVARIMYGSKHMTSSLGLGYAQGEGNLSGSTYDEKFESFRMLPQVAVTLGSYVTIGGGAEINWLNVREDAGAGAEGTYDYNLVRGVAGISYHNPFYEIGITYTSGAKDRSNVNNSNTGGGLSLADQQLDDGRRDVYVPDQGTLFVRGNLSDAWSIQSSTSLSKYDGNHAGAVGKYDRYEITDRLAGKLGATYWTSTRSRINATAEYRGGATAEAGLESNGLGYRAVNLYGGSVSAVYSAHRNAYVGVLAGYLRGEDDRTVDGVRYSNREQNVRIVGNFVAKI